MSGSSPSAIGRDVVPANDEPELIRLCRTRQWSSAIARAAQCPAEEAFASFAPHGTAIATACRYSAPGPVIYSLVAAIKRHMQRFPELRLRNPLRVNAEGRGTPLHEAVSNEDIELSCLRILIRADNEIEADNNGSNSTEAAVSVENIGSVTSAREIIPPRAIHAQDVDGQTPLHLLVRRIFRSCPRPASIGNVTESSISRTAIQDDYDATLLSILDELIEGFPQGCLIPDRREYEETPLVLALKASLYAQYRANPYNIRNDPGDAELSSRLWNEMLEDRIYTVVQRMLLACPSAAHHVAASGYTMLHSALFHGRCTRTVNALVIAAGRTSTITQSQSEGGRTHLRSFSQNSEQLNSGSNSPTINKTLSLSALIVQPNISQREVPLHICTMRGEVLPTLSLLADQGPQAVFARDIHGRTPMLWMWIHYCSTKYLTQNEALSMRAYSSEGRRRYSCKEVERTLTYLHMRHVPMDYLDRDLLKRKRLVELLHPYVEKISNSNENTGLESLLTSLAKLHKWGNTGDGRLEQSQENYEPEGYQQHYFVSPEEAGAVLFWEKALCLLRACSLSSRGATSEPEVQQNKATILHIAALNPCVPSSIVHIALFLYPNFAKKRDHLGRLPLHCAASRFTYKWKPSPQIPASTFQTTSDINWRQWNHEGHVSREQIISEPIVASVLHAYPEGIRVYDNCNRIPLHYAVEAAVKSLYIVDEHDYYSPKEGGMDLWNAFIKPLVAMWPGSVDQRDGVTKLYPFMQAAAKVDESLQCFINGNSFRFKEILHEQSSIRQLNIIYGMLRLNPELVRSEKSEIHTDKMPSKRKLHIVERNACLLYSSDKKRHRLG